MHYQATLFHKLISHSTCLLVVHPIDYYELVCKALRYKSLSGYYSQYNVLVSRAFVSRLTWVFWSEARTPFLLAHFGHFMYGSQFWVHLARMQQFRMLRRSLPRMVIWVSKGELA